jgi:hypothetical protein
MYRGSYGFTGVTARRFVTAALRRLNPANLSVTVARPRSAGHYTLNRQLAWKAPFILQDREHLGSAYVLISFTTVL